MTRSGTVLRTISGLSSVTGVAVAPNGDVYVTQLFTGAPFGSPGGVAVSNGKVYVSINSVSPTEVPRCGCPPDG